MKIFNRTLLKKISAPPQPLHDQCEPTNRTLHEIFSAGSAENFSRPEYFLRPGPERKIKKFCDGPRAKGQPTARRILRILLVPHLG